MDIAPTTSRSWSGGRFIVADSVAPVIECSNGKVEGLDQGQQLEFSKAIKSVESTGKGTVSLYTISYATLGEEETRQYYCLSSTKHVGQVNDCSIYVLDGEKVFRLDETTCTIPDKTYTVDDIGNLDSTPEYQTTCAVTQFTSDGMDTLHIQKISLENALLDRRVQKLCPVWP